METHPDRPHTSPKRQRGSSPLSCKDLRRPSLALRAGMAPVGLRVDEFLPVAIEKLISGVEPENDYLLIASQNGTAFG